MRDILYVIAKVQARAGKEEAIRGIMQPLIEPTKKEKGCISYELFNDRKNPTVFTLVEAWESEADLNTHLGQPHMQKVFAQLPDLVSAPPDIAYYTKLG